MQLGRREELCDFSICSGMATDMEAKHGGRPRPNDDVVVGDARPADESRTAVERRFRVSDTNRNAALNPWGKRVMRNAMLSCAFASAILSHTAFLSQNAVAESSEAGQTQPYKHSQIETRPEYRSGRKNRYRGRRRAEAVCGAEADGHGQMSVLAAAAKAEKGKEAPIPAVDEETLSLYPTAAQCGECHKQIYEEWSSSQHAYSSISPMFHAFEQKFQELTKGTVGTFCVRCHQQVGTQLGESSRNAALGDEPDLARGRDLHHLPPGQGAVRQGQRRAPGRAGQDLRAGLRQRRKERHQGHPRQQGNLLRQDQQRRAGHRASTTA